MDGHSSLVSVFGRRSRGVFSFSRKRRAHAQHEHQGQEDRYKLFHGFVSLLVFSDSGGIYHAQRVEPG